MIDLSGHHGFRLASVTFVQRFTHANDDAKPGSKRGRGVALHALRGTYVAQVAEVSVTGSKFTVDRVVCGCAKWCRAIGPRAQPSCGASLCTWFCRAGRPTCRVPDGMHPRAGGRGRGRPACGPPAA